MTGAPQKPKELSSLKRAEKSAEWKIALAQARRSLSIKSCDDQQLLILWQACDSSEQFHGLTRLIYQYGKTHPTQPSAFEPLIQRVDHSAYSLSQWLKALETFQTWLKEQNRTQDLKLMLEYLNCCLQTPDAANTGQTLSLTHILLQYLQSHGFDG